MSETIKYLTQKETEKLLKKIDSKRDKALFGLMYYYGLRCSEASRLKKENIRIDDGRIYIKASKNGVSGEYVLTKEAKKLLTPYLKERAGEEDQPLFISRKKGFLSTTQIRRLFYDYSKKAKIPEEKQHPHTLRHSIAVHLADSGVPVEVVQLHLRHRKIDSTMIYFQITSKKRHELQEKALSGDCVVRV